MAESDSTLGYRFAESKILAKTYNFNSTDHPRSFSGPVSGSISGPVSESGVFSFLNENLPETMETLRSHVNYLLTLPLPVHEKNRLLLDYWELEFSVEELHLLLDQALSDRLNSP